MGVPQAELITALIHDDFDLVFRVLDSADEPVLELIGCVSFFLTIARSATEHVAGESLETVWQRYLLMWESTENS